MVAPTLRPRIAAGRRYSVGVLADGSGITAGAVGADGVNVRDWREMVAVAAGNVHAAPNTGRGHVVGLLHDGSVRAAGWNKDGQCDVDGWTDVVGIAAGWRLTLAVRRDGRSPSGHKRALGRKLTWGNVNEIDPTMGGATPAMGRAVRPAACRCPAQGAPRRFRPPRPPRGLGRGRASSSSSPSPPRGATAHWSAKVVRPPWQ